MLEIAGGILIAMAIALFLAVAVLNPSALWGTVKMLGALACAAGLAILLVFQLAH